MFAFCYYLDPNVNEWEDAVKRFGYKWALNIYFNNPAKSEEEESVCKEN